MNKSAENFFINGCGRCSLGGTPQCKVHSWTQELDVLRQLILDSGLTEECKWGFPCYTHNGKNVVMLTAFKDNCGISFFKGSLINDEKQLLFLPGPNAHVGRLFKFKALSEIIEIEESIRNYLAQAVEIEESGQEIPQRKTTESIPEELAQLFEEDPMLQAAFEALTPGRQRGYLIHFSQPKQSKTRIARIERSVPFILKGIGFHDQYKSTKK